MKLIRQSAKVLAVSEIEGLPFSYKEGEKLMEYAGRLCYKSEDKITVDSHKLFLENLKKNGHMSVFEHSWGARIYSLYHDANPKALLTLSYNARYLSIAVIPRNEKSSNNFVGDLLLTGSERAFEEFWPVEQKKGIHYLTTEITDFAKDHNRQDLLSMTVHFVTNRAIANELVRHRTASYSQESTRYCNYNLGKFGSQCTFILPLWYDCEDVDLNDIATIYRCGVQGVDNWLTAMKTAEQQYNELIKTGQSAQSARGVLPLDTKTEIIMTANLMTWKHVINQRYFNVAGKAHRQIHRLMRRLLLELEYNTQTKWIADYLNNDERN